MNEPTTTETTTVETTTVETTNGAPATGEPATGEPASTERATTGPPTGDGRPPPLAVPSWRRRVPFYLLMAVGVLVVVQFLERRPREIDVYFVLSGLEVRTETGRLDRAHLVELNAEIREGEELRAHTTWRFRAGAPLEVGPARVRLRSGEYDVHFRLTFRTAEGAPAEGEVPAGAKRLFALRRRLAVTGDTERILLEVGGSGD